MPRLRCQGQVLSPVHTALIRIHLDAKLRKGKCIFHGFIVFVVFQVGIKDEASHSNAKTILLKMGEFFQIQVGLPIMTSTRLLISENLN